MEQNAPAVSDARKSLAARWSKMNQVGTKLAASCGEELPRCCQDSQLGHFVTSLDTISNDFFFLQVGGNSEKYENDKQSITFA
jgi:hypothetical protein